MGLYIIIYNGLETVSSRRSYIIGIGKDDFLEDGLDDTIKRLINNL